MAKSVTHERLQCYSDASWDLSSISHAFIVSQYTFQEERFTLAQVFIIMS